MMKIPKLISTWFIPHKQTGLSKFILYSIVITLIVFLLSISPLFQKFPQRDSGVFMYIGRSILLGKLPYIDIWDHKPPLIYFVNALGFILFNSNRWGVWLLEVISLVAAVLISIKAYAKIVGIEVALFITFIWLSTCIPLFEGGNLAEEYALPLQFAIIYFLSSKISIGGKSGFILGILISFCFLFKPNIVGFGLISLLVIGLDCIYMKKYKKLLSFCFGFLIACLLPILLLVLFFKSFEHLQSAWEAIFAYNIIYIERATLRQHIFVIAQLLIFVIPNGLLMFGLWGWLSSIRKIGSAKTIITKNPLKTIFVLSFIVEIMLVSVSGRPYRHYMISTLPMLSLGACYALKDLLDRYNWIVNYRLALVSLILIANGVLTVYTLSGQNIEYSRWGSTELVDTIKSFNPSNSSILIWGNEAGYYLLTNTQSPTKYAYQYPLQNCTAFSKKIVQTVTSDLKENMPVLIVDASASTLSTVPKISSDKDQQQGKCALFSKDMEALRMLVSSNYQQLKIIPSNQGNYIVYIRNKSY